MPGGFLEMKSVFEDRIEGPFAPETKTHSQILLNTATTVNALNLYSIYLHLATTRLFTTFLIIFASLKGRGGGGEGDYSGQTRYSKQKSNVSLTLFDFVHFSF